MEFIGFIDFAFLLSLGVTGSLHCAAMCGGISCAYTLPVAQKQPHLLRHYHTIYFAGRLFTYASLGAILGAAGMALATTIGPENPLQYTGALLGGSVMVLGGAATLFGKSWPDKISLWLASGPQHILRPLQKHMANLGVWRVLPLGMLSGILPCGLMWAVELRAFATNSWWKGLATMAVFCLITSISVFSTSYLMTRIPLQFRLRSLQISSLVVIVMGIALIARHTYYAEYTLDDWLNCLP